MSQTENQPSQQDGSPMTVLESICHGVAQDVAARQQQIPLEQIRQMAADAPAALDAHAALAAGASANGGVHVIAEVKRKSPSKGALAQIPEPGMLAAAYERGGATVISVLTEQRRFGGSLEDLDEVRAAVGIPVLRKDFMVTEYQFFEARAHGADLVLLIVAALDDQQLRRYLELTRQLGMSALVETHTEEEIQRAAAAGAKIIGVNVRNLKTLEVENARFGELSDLIPEGAVVIAESGVADVRDVQAYAAQGAHAVLVGEALVKHASPEQTVREFSSVPRRP